MKEFKIIGDVLVEYTGNEKEVDMPLQAVRVLPVLRFQIHCQV